MLVDAHLNDRSCLVFSLKNAEKNVVEYRNWQNEVDKWTA
jgi:hypothetical protein